jgi:tetratricopeptide (TPR) repeat protein
MAKLKQLVEAIKAVGYKVGPIEVSKHWIEVKQMINQMTPEDFAVTYDKDESYDNIPLFRAMRAQNPDLAELIIKKNPVFAAKIVDNIGFTGLHHACCCFQPSDALKIVNLLIPYMSQEAIISRTLPTQGNYTFLHMAIDHHQYKLAASIAPELLSVILKSSSAERSYSSLVKFIYDAVNVYDMEISLNPDIADNHFRKGILLQALNKQEKAVKCYNKAIQLDANYVDKVEKIMPTASLTQPEVSSPENPELMKSKIAALTKEISDMNEKSLSLSKELAQLSSKVKAVEEHKGQRVDVDVLPPYEEPSQEEMVLMGKVDTYDIALHS